MKWHLVPLAVMTVVNGVSAFYLHSMFSGVLTAFGLGVLVTLLVMDR